MISKNKNNRITFVCTFVAFVMVFSQSKINIHANELVNTKNVIINEIESKDVESGNDWVEIINISEEDVDISGWFLSDDKELNRFETEEAIKIKADTVLKAGEVLVLEQNTDFKFGLGKEDAAILYNANNEVIDSYSWDKHAKGTLARVPDGMGDFKDQEPTKGKLNVVKEEKSKPLGVIVINEINSTPDDWVEFMNIGTEVMDISGYEIRDDSDNHRWKFPKNTKIKSGELLLVNAKSKGLVYNKKTEDYSEGEFEAAFGIGSSDSIRLYDTYGKLLDEYSWTNHASYKGDAAATSFGRYPDGAGEFTLMKETPGKSNEVYDLATEIINGESEEANKTDKNLDVIAWPGKEEVITYDTKKMFLKDSSGLDFYDGQLYVVDNGSGKFWILDVNEDGTLDFVKGFENGKRARFKKDDENLEAKGPDAEGISVDSDKLVYIASERDNSDKGVNYNVILQIDPYAEGTDLTALKEWDLTDSLPKVSANMGIEAVEWIANEDVNGKLFDKNTNAPFDSAKYPNAVGKGIFFVALEANGHVYAYVLNDDGTEIQIADIDSKLGAAMALDYDVSEKVLWVVTDYGFENKAAIISLTGKSDVKVVHAKPPSGLDITRDNEGFAIAEINFTKDGQRPVYRIADGFKTGALTIGSISSKYNETIKSDIVPD